MFKIIYKNISYLFLGLCALTTSLPSAAQMKFSRNAKISFYSRAPIENIEATNNEVASFLNLEKGEFAFIVLIRSFRFKKALMEEHFNENYLESNKYPKANFKGKIADPDKIDFSKDGTYPVVVSGDITIHGITKNITVPGNIIVANGKLSANAKFNIAIKDYNIKIPSAVINHIADVVEITVDCVYETYGK